MVFRVILMIVKDTGDTPFRKELEGDAEQVAGKREDFHWTVRCHLIPAVL